MIHGERSFTDSIPRAAISQELEIASLLSDGRPRSFENVRQALLAMSRRKAPASAEAMWTVARDVLSDLTKLGFVKCGPLPRKRSEVARLLETPCEATQLGQGLGQEFNAKRSDGFDRLLRAWLTGHPYFRLFLRRLGQSALFVPDLTSIKQLGAEAVTGGLLGDLPDRVAASCSRRVIEAGWEAERAARLAEGIRGRAVQIRDAKDLAGTDVKTLIDLLQDGAVSPAFLESEALPFDPVTFQQLLRVTQEFLVAAWTSSHPAFAGRVVFSTCDFSPPSALASDGAVSEIHYHGRAFAFGAFPQALLAAWKQVSDARGGYVDAYQIRALVCTSLRIQPRVFAMCLELVKAGAPGFDVFTELPFSPPPQGEEYLVLGSRRVGSLKLLMREGS